MEKEPRYWFLTFRLHFAERATGKFRVRLKATTREKAQSKLDAFIRRTIDPEVLSVEPGLSDGEIERLKAHLDDIKNAAQAKDWEGITKSTRAAIMELVEKDPEMNEILKQLDSL